MESVKGRSRHESATPNRLLSNLAKSGLAPAPTKTEASEGANIAKAFNFKETPIVSSPLMSNSERKRLKRSLAQNSPAASVPVPSNKAFNFKDALPSEHTNPGPLLSKSEKKKLKRSLQYPPHSEATSSTANVQKGGKTNPVADSGAGLKQVAAPKQNGTTRPPKQSTLAHSFNAGTRASQPAKKKKGVQQFPMAGAPQPAKKKKGVQQFPMAGAKAETKKKSSLFNFLGSL